MEKQICWALAKIYKCSYNFGKKNNANLKQECDVWSGEMSKGVIDVSADRVKPGGPWPVVGFLNVHLEQLA